MADELVEHAQAGAQATEAPAVPATTGWVNTKPQSKSGDKWWQSMLAAVFLIGGGIWLFKIFNDLEQKGGSIRMNVVIIGIYKMLGKWGVLGVMVFGGIVALIIGIRQLVASRAQES